MWYIDDLVKMADKLDSLGLVKEANEIDDIIKLALPRVSIEDLNLTPDEISKLKRKDPTILQKVWRLLTQWAPNRYDNTDGNSISGVRG